MSSPAPQGFAAQVFVAGNGPTTERLRQKKTILDRLCATLHEFLSHDIDTAIQMCDWRPPTPPRPTIEDLNRAQQDLDMAHGQIDALERLCEQMPQEIREAYLESQRPTLDRLFQQMEERVSSIQKAMEEPEPDPSNPWDRSRRIGIMCAICARDFERVEFSPAAMKVALKAAGWGRDVDGDHICPACFTASTNPSPETTAPADTSTSTETGSQQEDSL